MKPSGTLPVVLPLVLVSTLVICGFFVNGVSGLFNLTLVHTSDTSSALTAMDQYSNPCKPVNASSYVSAQGLACYGGAARMKTVIEGVRARAPNSSLLIDAGNVLKTSLFYFLFGPSLIASYFDQLGYDFVHWQILDFVALVPNVVEFMQHAGSDVEFVVSNLEGFADDPRANGTVISAYAIKTFPGQGTGGGDEKVGFAATLAENLNSLVAYSQSLNSTEETDALLVAVASLQNQGVNKIVASVSSNSTAEQVLAAVPGIDILIVPGQLQANAAASMGPVGPYPMVYQTRWLQNVLVVSSGTFGQLIGVLDVTFDDNGVITAYSGDTVLMDDSVAPDPTLQTALIDEYAQIEAKYTSVIGYSAVDLAFQQNCLFAECTIGDWTGDLFKQLGNTQIAFNNGGSVRAGISKGAITLGQEQTAFPFGTAMHYTYKLKGEYVWQALENGVSLATATNLDVNSGAGKFLQVGGLRFTFNPNMTVGSRVVDAWVEVSAGVWQLLDTEVLYTVSSFEWFVIIGGDDYGMVRDNAIDVEQTGYSFNSMLFAGFEQNITAVEGGRITTTTASRLTCMASDGTLCSGNGYCLAGVCHCTVEGAEGSLCAPVNASGSGSSTSESLGIALGVTLPLLALIALCVVAAVVAYRIRAGRSGHDAWEIDITELEMGPLLGAGGFGEVYRAVWKGTDVAVKIMSAQSAGKVACENFKQVRITNTLNSWVEVHVMTALRHPNVVLFMAACTKPPQMCIVMELMSLGSLYDLLHNELVPSIPLSLSLKMAYQAAKGMHFLHSSGIVHRDLKSLNLLLDAKWNLKVSDFGLTKFRADLKRAGGEVEGTVHWSAPEVLGDGLDVDYMQADVYSFGIIMWELLTREQPYCGLTPAAVAVGVIRDSMRPDIELAQERHVEYEQLMAQCWHQDPTMRPPFLDVMSNLATMLSHGGYDVTGTGTGTSSSSATYGVHRSGFNSSSNSSSESKEAAAAGGAHQTVLSPPAGEHLTVVMSDIANAAPLWEANPSAMRQAMSEHNRIVRQLMTHHRGYESVFLKNHAGGEGYFCVVFSRAIDAVRWSDEVQRELLKVDWPLDLIKHELAQEEIGGPRDHVIYRGLRVRMGIHLGYTSRMRDPKSGRFEFSGPAVQIATELAMHAEGGHVLVSRELTAATDGASSADSGKPPSGRYVSLGVLEVNGKNGGSTTDVEIFEMRVSGLEERVGGLVGGHATTSSGHGTTSGSSTDITGRPLRSVLPMSDMYIGSSNACRWIIPYEELAMTKVDVGQGSYGVVSKARWKGIEVAVKRFIKQRLDEDTMLRFREEAAMMAELRHPNVVLFIGACVRSPNMCIITEWIPKGSLRDVLANHSVKFPWPTRLRVLHGIVLGLSYLHSQSPPIMHRDLKSSNVLVDESWNAKIADFGFARIKEENVTMTKCGTPAWIAPEVVRREHYTEKADIYSLSILMWEVATRKMPFSGENFAKISLEVLEGKRPAVPSNIPKSYAALMGRCWHRKPHKRPAADELCKTIEEWLDNPKAEEMV